MKIAFLRKKYIIGEPMQLKYLMVLLLSMLIPLLFVGGCLYFLIFNIMAEQLGIPEYIAYNLFPVIKKIDLILVLGFPPLVILLLLWGVILSHRIAGPIKRLKAELDNIAKSGDYTKRLKVRKYDDLKELVASINNVLGKVCSEKEK